MKMISLYPPGLSMLLQMEYFLLFLVADKYLIICMFIYTLCLLCPFILFTLMWAVLHSSGFLLCITASNPCSNTRCSHLCLLSSKSLYSCACPSGWSLARDAVTCVRGRVCPLSTLWRWNLPSNSKALADGVCAVSSGSAGYLWGGYVMGWVNWAP